MDAELVSRLARDAGLEGYPDELERFARMVAEECAKVVDEQAARWRIVEHNEARRTADECAAAIRAKFVASI